LAHLGRPASSRSTSWSMSSACSRATCSIAFVRPSRSSRIAAESPSCRTKVACAA
jgi:hypothetical protein